MIYAVTDVYRHSLFCSRRVLFMSSMLKTEAHNYKIVPFSIKIEVFCYTQNISNMHDTHLALAMRLNVGLSSERHSIWSNVVIK